jgi:hypothetical protein
MIKFAWFSTTTHLLVSLSPAARGWFSNYSCTKADTLVLLAYLVRTYAW